MSGLDGDDYATLASIEDHLRRIADALERTHPKFHPGGYVGGGYTIPEMPSCGYGRVATRDAIRAELAGKPCDDRTCTDRDHWAPRGPNQCDPGCTRPSLHDGDCDNHRATGLGAAWDACEVAEGYLDGLGAARPNGNDSMAFHSFREAYDWIAEPDPLAEIMTAIETGCDMVTYSLRPQSNAQQTVDAMHAAVALLRETVMRYTGPAVTVDARSLETGEPVPASVTVRKVADPLDEDDHRPRHFANGEHLWRYACGHWHMATRDRCNDPDHGDGYTLAWWDEPLTFCDCP